MRARFPTWSERKRCPAAGIEAEADGVSLYSKLDNRSPCTLISCCCRCNSCSCKEAWARKSDAAISCSVAWSEFSDETGEAPIKAVICWLNRAFARSSSSARSLWARMSVFKRATVLVSQLSMSTELEVLSPNIDSKLGLFFIREAMLMDTELLKGVNMILVNLCEQVGRQTTGIGTSAALRAVQMRTLVQYNFLKWPHFQVDSSNCYIESVRKKNGRRHGFRHICTDLHWVLRINWLPRLYVNFERRIAPVSAF